MQSLCLRTPLATIHCNTGAIVLSLSSQSRFVFPSETGPVGDRNRRRPQRRTGPPCQVGSGWAYPLRQCLVLSHGDLPSRERFGRCDRAVVVVGCQLGAPAGAPDWSIGVWGAWKQCWNVHDWVLVCQSSRFGTSKALRTGRFPVYFGSHRKPSHSHED